MPDSLYTPIITAIITATVTLLAVYLANRGNANRLSLQLQHERDTRRDALYREKLEELYVLVQQYTTLLQSESLPYVRVMEGELDYNQALDMTIKTMGQDRLPDFNRLPMLVDLYFPQIRGTLKQLLDTRDSMNKIRAAHKSEYKKGNLDGRMFVKPMVAALDRIEEVGEMLKSEITSLEKAS
jgi:hypothetical protein